MKEVKEYNPHDEINFSALAKRYPITVKKSGKLAANPGQIVKQYLIEKGIDVDSFNNRYSIKRVKRSRLTYMFFFLIPDASKKFPMFYDLMQTVINLKFQDSRMRMNTKPNGKQKSKRSVVL